MNQIVIKARFKFYEYVVCDDHRTLYQLEHFKNKRTYPFKKLTYNPQRKAYRINSNWVSKKRLLKLMIKTNEIITINKPLTNLEALIKQCTRNIKIN